MIFSGSTVRIDVYGASNLTNDQLGAKNKCNELGLTLLGDIPLHAQICTDADAGKPTVVASPESPQAKAFATVAQELASKLQL